MRDYAAADLSSDQVLLGQPQCCKTSAQAWADMIVTAVCSKAFHIAVSRSYIDSIEGNVASTAFPSLHCILNLLCAYSTQAHLFSDSVSSLIGR